MARIAVGGIQHETNTFMPTVTDYDYFCEKRDRPPLARGPEVLEWLAGSSFGMSGFLSEIGDEHELVPLVWAGGGAGGMVTDEAFERIAGELIGALSQQMPVDAVYLDQHGAMVTARYQDADGELLRRVRDCVGPDVPIAASLDYHANISPAMVENADALVAYRTYPHVDRWETGERAARAIELMVERGRPAGRAFRHLSFVVPSHQQPSEMEPTKSFIEMCDAGETGDVFNLSYLGGFRLSDIYHCGVSVVASAWTQDAAETAADAVEAEILRREHEFAEPMHEPDACVAKAMEIAASASKPVLICDPQDNPGGGGSGDTTGMLAALVRGGAEGAVVGTMHDAPAAAAAHEAGIGAEVTLDIGGRTPIDGNEPFRSTFTVRALGDGRMRTTGPVVGGRDIDIGPMALLETGGVGVVVTTKRVQAYDQALFRHLGIEPAEQKILGLKSAVHFRGDFEPIAEAVLVVKAPGGCPADPRDLPYRNLKPGTRLGAKGPPVAPLTNR
ncbi:MAG: M81 family metallopeptidase [Pseudomonadota bacterium]